MKYLFWIDVRPFFCFLLVVFFFYRGAVALSAYFFPFDVLDGRC